MAEDIEKVLTQQITAVLGDTGKNTDDLVEQLVSDVIWYDSWYGVELGPDSIEIQVDYGTPLQELISGNGARRALAKTIRSFVVMDTNNKSGVNVDEIVRLNLERIVNWKKWYPSWYQDQNFKAWAEVEDQDFEIYTAADGYGEGDNGADGVF